MKKATFFVLVGILALALFSNCGTREEGKVVARVGDREITTQDLENEWKQASRLKIRGISELQRKKELVDKLVGDQVVIMEAYKEGLDNEVEADSGFIGQKERIILNVLYQREIVDKSQPTESEMRKEYDRMKEEVRASHILVETEEEADQIYQTVKAGADFSELAKEKSIDPSAKDNGGDLGFFTWGKMVPDFQEAAFALKEGEISRPIKTTYGWHVIKLIERREKEQPAYEESKKLIESKLVQTKREERVKEYFAELRKKAGFKINQEAYDLLMSKKEEVPPDTLGLKRPGDILDLNKLTIEERDMALCTYSDGTITIGQFAEQFNNMPQPYRPRLHEREKVEETAFGTLVQGLLIDVAKRQNIEESKEFKKQWDVVIEREMAKRMTSDVILKGVGISDEEIQSYYQRNIDRFTVQPQVNVREILVKTEEEAQGLLAQLKAGADFSKLATDNTIRTYAKGSGGLLGSFPRTRYPEIFDASQDMKIGSLRGPIKLSDRQFGEAYSVIRLEEKTEGKVQPLEEVKERVINMARREKDQTIFQNWVQNAKARYKIEIYDEVIESTVQEMEEPAEEKG